MSRKEMDEVLMDYLTRNLRQNGITFQYLGVVEERGTKGR
jgi:hypothetical protein